MIINLPYSNVSDPIWTNEAHTVVDCVVEFDHLVDPVAFSASPEDSWEHGRGIFARCANGDFGPIKEYDGPKKTVVS